VDILRRLPTRRFDGSGNASHRRRELLEGTWCTGLQRASAKAGTGSARMYHQPLRETIGAVVWKPSAIGMGKAGQDQEKGVRCLADEASLA
jgi:hypothetical protein